MDCDICQKPMGKHEPWLVWHTGWDGCDMCDADYEKGIVLCRVCAGAAQYALNLEASKYVPELDEELDWWARKTLWNAVWDPSILTVAEANAARRWLDHMGRADADPAMDWLPYDHWETREEFARRSAPTLLRRFGLSESDLNRLEGACLEWSHDCWATATQDAREVERRLRDA